MSVFIAQPRSDGDLIGGPKQCALGAKIREAEPTNRPVLLRGRTNRLQGWILLSDFGNFGQTYSMILDYRLRFGPSSSLPGVKERGAIGRDLSSSKRDCRGVTPASMG
jgi:hypothetical protein